MYDRPAGASELARATYTKGRNGLFKRNADRKVWLFAWALTVLLHALLVLFFQNLPPLQASAVTIRKPEPIRLNFVQPATPAEKNQEPQFFSELPPDRADKRPEKPQFLSNVTSRARDRTPGGNSDLPKMTGESDAPLVKMQKDGGAPPSPPQPQQAPSQSSPQEPGAAGGGSGTSILQRSPAQAQPLVHLRSEDAFKGADGSSDINQPEMHNPDGDASVLGDVSLNTIAWDYAPWLQRFGRQLMERWHAPSAYLYGILKEGGWGVFEVEIAKSGKILRIDKLEEQGHPSLIQAANGALRSMAPVEPLPSDFPEPTLILRIRMIYPKVRPQ